jgi:hypothetical protein
MRARLELWAYRTPWGLAAVEAVVFGILASLAFGFAVGIAVAVVGFVAFGWSFSRGPGRRSLERRIADRDSN